VTLRALFATRIYEASLAQEPGFAAFNAELEEACRMLAAEDRAGRAWCKAHGYRGYTSYASLDDLPRRASVFGQLKTRLDRHAAAYARALGFDLGGRRLKLDSLWANVMRPGGAHSGHLHPLSVLSGTVYVAVPEGAGGLRLEDPRLQAMMARPPLLPEAGERPFVTLAPQPGSVLMWESWLRHEVPPHAGRGDRVSLSFNYAW
jgi:uncharacterized protein (TIGR02466 family)